MHGLRPHTLDGHLALYKATLHHAGNVLPRILEINQVVAYFAYVNRSVQGLGVSHVGEVLGLAPTNTDDEGDVAHR